MTVHTLNDMQRAALAITAALVCAAIPLHASATEPVLPAGVVAFVNGQPIQRSLLDELAKAREPEGQSRARLVNDLVTTELLSQRARSTGLAARPQTQAELELAHKTLLGQRLMQQLASEMVISDDALQARYRELQPEADLTVNHILVADEATARQLIAQLESGRARFAALARKHSVDTESRDKGGQLGTLNSNELTASFVAAARALKPGSYTHQPVRTEAGWHVIQLRAIRLLQKPAFEAASASLRTQIVSERLEAQIAQWRNEAKLTRLQAP